MALVLTRGQGDSITLAHCLELTVTDISAGQVTVALDRAGAPGPDAVSHRFDGPEDELRVGPVHVRARVDERRPWQAKLTIAAPQRIHIMRSELL